MRFYLQLARQLVNLFELGYIHGDIKLENMVFDKADKNIYLIDFGYSQRIEDNLKFAGTPIYLSPDKCATIFGATLKVKPIDDWYSLVILIAMIEGEGITKIFLKVKE